MVAKSMKEDDLGLPESPIYSNYVKNLWKRHTRTGGVQSPNRSRENTDGPLPLQVERLPPVVNPAPLADGKARAKTAD
jgi:hypothetical protein